MQLYTLLNKHKIINTADTWYDDKNTDSLLDLSLMHTENIQVPVCTFGDILAHIKQVKICKFVS